MKLVEWPEPKKLEKISPTLYLSLKKCMLKGYLDANKTYEKYKIIHPKAVLGTVSHKIIYQAHKGRFDSSLPSLRGVVQKTYQDECHTLFNFINENYIFSNRYTAYQDWPGYNIVFSRLYKLIKEITRKRTTNYSFIKKYSHYNEIAYTYKDVLKGIPDRVVIKDTEEVLFEEFKTSNILEGRKLKEDIQDQILLYAFLLFEHYKCKVKARITSTKNETYEEYIDIRQAKEIADDAISIFETINSEIDNISKGILNYIKLASPSVDSCNYCSYKFRCDAFWDSHAPTLPENKLFYFKGSLIKLYNENKQSITAEFNILLGNINTANVIIRGMEPSVELNEQNIYRILNIKKEFDDNNSNIYKFTSYSTIWTE